MKSFNLETERSFWDSVGPKRMATLHFDKLSRQLCPHLEHFVVFSSVISYCGNATQTAYAMANSAMEIICEKRKHRKFPALAVEWGPISEVGLLPEKLNFDKNVNLCNVIKD